MGEQAPREESRVQHQQELLDLARRVLPGGALTHFRVPADVALVAARGRGSRVWDTAGKEYIDWVLGSGPLLVGHSHPAVVSAVQKAVESGSTYYALNEYAIRLAATMVEAIPCAEQVMFCSDGSVATFYALRLARAYTGRQKIVKFEGAYHGFHDYVRFHKIDDPADYPHAKPDSAGIPDAVAETVLTLPYNDLEMAQEILPRYADDIAAIIVEPMQRSIVPASGFLAGLRDLSRQIGALLIFDEVVTGFRLAYGGAQEYYQVIPDMATYGKVIGGGYPLAAVAGPREIISLADSQGRDPRSIFFNGTLNGNPVAAIAGLATLEILKEPGIYDRLNQAGRQLRRRVGQIFASAGVKAQVLGDGPMFQFLFTDQPVRNHRDTMAGDSRAVRQLARELVRRGMLINVSKGYISTAHQGADLNALVEAVADVLAQWDRADNSAENT